MSKFIDADRLKAEIDKKYMTEIHPWLSGVSAKSAIYEYVIPTIEALQQEEPDPKELPTLRQAIEEHMYDQIIHKIPSCPPHSGVKVSLNLRPSTVRKLKKDYEQNGIPATAVGTVFTNTDPMNLYVESDKWNALLGQFENGQRVRIIIVKEDAE